MNHEVLKAAKAEGKATLAVVNGKFVNVYTGEIYDGGVACYGEHVIATGEVDYAIGPDTEVIDAQGKFIVPGFVEAHIHPESSNLSVQRFAEVVLEHGTTSVFTDFHEIGIVRGLEGMHAAIEEGKKTPVRFWWCVPSHIPFCPGLESAGAYLSSKELIPELDHETAVALNEVVSAYVVQEDEDLLKTVAGANEKRKTLVGHGPKTYGPDWNGFASLGIANDHEALDEADVLERARNGVYTHLRHNLICPSGPNLFKTILDHDLDRRLFSFVTDDTNAIALTEVGHIDGIARAAMRSGIDFVSAIQMSTLNPATSYHMERRIGGLAPGRFADILLLSDDSADFTVDLTIAGGEVVARDGEFIGDRTVFEHEPVMFGTFSVKDEIRGDSLVHRVDPSVRSARVHVMKTWPWIPYTDGFEHEVPAADGKLGCDVANDVLHMAVVERHKATGNIGRGWLAGFTLRSGSIATSMAHDSHNIVVMGTDPDDMALAVNRVIEMDGGVAIYDGGEKVHEIAMPQFGFLSDLSAREMAAEKKKLIAAMRERGCEVIEPHMFLFFMTIIPIPNYRLTDVGYIHSKPEKFELMDNILELKKGEARA